MPRGARIAELFRWQDCGIAIDSCGFSDKFVSGRRRKDVVVRCNYIEQRVVWVLDEFAWCIGKRDRLLQEVVGKVFNGENSVLFVSAGGSSKELEKCCRE
jgi:hypothetical protein